MVPLDPAALLSALAALVSAGAGIVMSYSAVVKARGEAKAKADEDCERKVKELRAEAEEAWDKVRELRRSQ